MTFAKETYPNGHHIERVKIDKVLTDVNPEVKEYLCGCGGTLRYRAFPYTDQYVEIGEIHGYKCDSCGNVLFPEAIADEMDQRFDEAMK